MEKMSEFVGVWMNERQRERLDLLCEISGQSRSQVIRELIDGHVIKNKSWARACSAIASLGGLIKKSARQDEVYALGQEIVKIAHEMRHENAADSKKD